MTARTLNPAPDPIRPDRSPVVTDLRESARRALQSLNDLIADSPDPGVEALGAQYELQLALIAGTAARVDVRDQVRRAICEAEGFAWDDDGLEPDEYGEVADAVLAILADSPHHAPRAPDTSGTRRERYAAAVNTIVGYPSATMIDAVMAVADAEIAERNATTAPADRAAVLREVEQVVRAAASNCAYASDAGCAFCNGVDAALEQIRRLVDEAQQPEATRRIPLPGIPECGPDCGCRGAEGAQR